MKKAIKIILISFSLLLFTQCILTKKQKNDFLAKHCQRKDSASYVYKDSIVHKDSLIYVPTIVNQPIYLENPCKTLCDSLGNLKPFTKTTKNNGLRSTVKQVGNTIVFDCQTDSLSARIQWLEHQITISKYSHTENTIEKPCYLPHETSFDGFTKWWFIITAGGTLVYFGIKRLKAIRI